MPGRSLFGNSTSLDFLVLAARASRCCGAIGWLWVPARREPRLIYVKVMVLGCTRLCAGLPTPHFPAKCDRAIFHHLVFRVTHRRPMSSVGKHRLIHQVASDVFEMVNYSRHFESALATQTHLPQTLRPLAQLPTRSNYSPRSPLGR